MARSVALAGSHPLWVTTRPYRSGARTGDPDHRLAWAHAGSPVSARVPPLPGPAPVFLRRDRVPGAARAAPRRRRCAGGGVRGRLRELRAATPVRLRTGSGDAATTARVRRAAAVPHHLPGPVPPGRGPGGGLGGTGPGRLGRDRPGGQPYRDDRRARGDGRSIEVHPRRGAGGTGSRDHLPRGPGGIRAGAGAVRPGPAGGGGPPPPPPPPPPRRGPRAAGRPPPRAGARAPPGGRSSPPAR